MNTVINKEIFDKAQESINSVAEYMGLKAPQDPPKAVKDLEFPEDITAITLREVSRYMSIYTHLASYTTSILSYFDTSRMVLDSQIEIKEAEIILSFKGTVQERKSKVLVETRELQEKRLSIEVAVVYIRAILKGYEFYLSTLSRELTRRLAENTNIGRNLKNE